MNCDIWTGGGKAGVSSGGFTRGPLCRVKSERYLEQYYVVSAKGGNPDRSTESRSDVTKASHEV